MLPQSLTPRHLDEQQQAKISYEHFTPESHQIWYRDITRTISLLVSKHYIPREKIILGAAFYGRQWKDAGPVNKGLFQPAKGIGSISFNKITSLLHSGKYIRYWDPKAMAPTLYNKDEKIFVSYEDERSVARKVDYVYLHDLGGIMYWEYFSDDRFRLANAIKHQVKSVKKQYVDYGMPGF